MALSTVLAGFDILSCIAAHRMPGFLIPSFALAAFSGAVALIALDRARPKKGPKRYGWLLMATFAIGGGAWGAHHVALISYLGPARTSFRSNITMEALLLVLCTSFVALKFHLRVPGTGGRLASAVALGGGIALMHFTAMGGLNLPVRLHLLPAAVVFACLAAFLLAYLTVSCWDKPRSRGNAMLAIASLALTICATHLLAMVGMRLEPIAVQLDNNPLTAGSVALYVGLVVLGVSSVALLIALLNRQARIARQRAELQFSLLMAGTTDYAICMLDVDGQVSHWNTGATRLTGYEADEALGMPFARLFSVQDRADGTPAMALSTAREDGLCHGNWLCERRDGSQFWSQGAIERICDKHGQPLGFSFITHDITELKAAWDGAAAARALLDTALDNMHQGVILFDAGERLLLANAAFYHIWGIEPGQCQPGITLDEMAQAGFISADRRPMSHERLAQIRRGLQAAIADGKAPAFITEVRENLVLAISDRPIPGGGWITTFEDITAQRQSEVKIEHMALHDALTGLPNRTRFYRRFDTMIAEAADAGEQLAVVAIDLDRFKEINDTCGHATGDLLLQIIARRMADGLGEQEEVARFGGDEFAAAKRFADRAELDAFLERMHACVIEPVDAISGTMGVGASLGVAIYPADGSDRDTLLNNADLAMYRAKSHLTQHVCFFEPGMDETARARRQLANDLRFAIERNELALLYQPQRSLRSGALSGYEALLRWHHPQRGLVPPDEFIPIAEETGEIFAIGEWVLREACAEACAWDPLLKVAVNLSPVQFLRDGLVERVREIIVLTGLSPDRLELEITETAIITDKLRALHCLRQFKAMGISVAIDDFGTGYSSLDTLNAFPFDKIKIDKSFLARAENSGQARAIIRAILALGKSLSIPVLAEGLETENQLKVLEREGCDEAQGYYFGRPALPPSSMTRKVSNS